MKVIKPSVDFFGAVPTDYAATLRFIEMASRICYKSEDKITTGSAEGFVKRLIKAGHLAMVEHSNFVVRTGRIDQPPALPGDLGRYLNVVVADHCTYVGGSLTAWAKRYDEYLDDQCPVDDSVFTPFFKIYGDLFGRFTEGEHTGWDVCPHNEIPGELHRYAAKFICCRGVSHELVRHRPCSFAQESTRYVNYAGKDMKFIEPAGFESWSDAAHHWFIAQCKNAEGTYNGLLTEGLTPQQARAVLPNALKTEIVVTADRAEWCHIKKLRTHPSAHPDMVRVMNLMPWAFTDK